MGCVSATENLSLDNQNNSSIESSDLVKIYKNDSQFQATFYDDDGSLLINSGVVFEISNSFYYRTTGLNGVATININLLPGTYNITSFNLVTGENKTNNIEVLSSIQGNNLIKYYKNDSQYYATFINGDGSPLKNTAVQFNINGVYYTRTTDSNGLASLNINLNQGYYVLTAIHPINGQQYSNYVIVLAILDAKNLVMKYKDGSKFYVTLLDNYGKSLSNVNIDFNINGVVYHKLTDENGVASLNINLNIGKYTITSSYNGCQISNIIQVAQTVVNMNSSVLITEPGKGDSFKVYLTVDNKPLSNVNVVFTINGVDYVRTSDANGIASLKINLGVGLYVIYYKLQNPQYGGFDHNYIIVNGTKFISKYTIIENQSYPKFSVQLVDAILRPMAGKLIKFTFNGQNYNVYTDLNGVATVYIPVLPDGIYTIYFEYYESGKKVSSGQQTIQYGRIVELEDILNSAYNLRYYIGDNCEIPSHVTVSGKDYTIAEFTYLMAHAIINYCGFSEEGVWFKKVNAPKNLIDTGSFENLDSYDSVAQYIVDYVNANGIIPEIVVSEVGELGFKNLVYLFSRILAYKHFYGDMPDFRSVKSIDPVELRVLNTKNTISDLSPYLQETLNCEVNDVRIQELAYSLTEGLTSDIDKIIAIFDYVRDNIQYSSYYNTRYGAVDTLELKKGNCCDQAHLIIALLRASNLPARYVHGFCHFADGEYTGHVWAQVCIDGVWVVVDPVGGLNSAGVVENWDNYNYEHSSYYLSLPF